VLPLESILMPGECRDRGDDVLVCNWRLGNGGYFVRSFIDSKGEYLLLESILGRTVQGAIIPAAVDHLYNRSL
jgi:hypothetical protein